LEAGFDVLMNMGPDGKDLEAESQDIKHVALSLLEVNKS
jgi:hypothetical protein